jgi:4'-phosphopantetheinyl transferase
VHAWIASAENVSAAGVESARAVLSVDERARADRLFFASDRRDFILAHFLLRHCLSKAGRLGPEAWRFERGPAGKPCLAEQSGPEFNLSHARDLVACAINDREVGIDVERGDTLSRRHASVERSFARAEIEFLARYGGVENTLMFAELWTLKEAFLKAVGVGLDLPLDSFAFDLSRTGAIAFQAPPGFRAREWHFALFEPLALSRLAVAVRADTPPRFVVLRFAPGIADQDMLPFADEDMLPLRPLRKTLL